MMAGAHTYRAFASKIESDVTLEEDTPEEDDVVEARGE